MKGNDSGWKRERDVKCTPDRAIINPDVLSCQDGVNGADMTQMKSRALVENAEKHVAIFRLHSDIYSQRLNRVVCGRTRMCVCTCVCE